MSDQINAYIANCKACPLAEVMKDCPYCLFNVGKLEAAEPTITKPKRQPATGADIFRIWRELWGNVPFEYVYNQWQIAQTRDAELMDLTQI